MEASIDPYLLTMAVLFALTIILKYKESAYNLQCVPSGLLGSSRSRRSPRNESGKGPQTSGEKFCYVLACCRCCRCCLFVVCYCLFLFVIVCCLLFVCCLLLFVCLFVCYCLLLLFVVVCCYDLLLLFVVCCEFYCMVVM